MSYTVGQTTSFQPSLADQVTIEQRPKFGTFFGIYVPSILMMFGVIIFLRLGWIVGSAGLYSTLFIITLASIITLITILSMSAAATNIKVGKGGAYYIISRALGLEVGSSIGIPLFLKQSISVSFCIVGFTESFQSLFPQFSAVAIGIATLCVLTLLAYVSTNFALKIQLVIFVIIIASLYSLFTGNPANLDLYSYTPLNDSSPSSFWAIFAIFFPALTGIESSASLSGDLKDPSRSLPLGTITAVLTAYVIYIGISLFLFETVPLDRLVMDPLVIQHVAKFESLIILGIWGATLSSAIGGLLGAPRTLQALAEDGIVPRIFAREYGPYCEPRIATALTVAIALIGICFGSINVIAPLLTMICLICYAVLNLATGLEDLMSNPSWRPTFPLPWIISLTGTLLCVIAMLMINSGAAILALGLVFVIYLALKRQRINTAWDDIRYGIFMFFSRAVIYRLANEMPSSRSWRPNFLVFTGKPSLVSDQLLSFSNAIAHSKGFLTMASFFSPEQASQAQITQLDQRIKTLLKHHDIQALVTLHQAKSVSSGMKQMIAHYGIGPLTPNTIVCGGTSQEETLISYLEVIKLAHKRGKNVVILNDEQKSFEFPFKKPVIKGDIHIWWDDNSQRNCELMMVFAYMLRKNPSWKKTRICLVSLVSDEQIRQQRMQEFQELIKKNRLNIETTVLVASNPEQEKIQVMRFFSTQAAMVFMGMRAPAEGETLEEYGAYFQALPQKATDFPPVALVLSAEQTNLEEVLKLQLEVLEGEL
ncbi:amino acid permease [Candidatus Protochlamydia amoebophila]|uniref:Putative bumetanide-sensitive Na-K-Cl n=1 Tax=Candidatus Protochlamydia amoebophila TaxID=362787 RepID=A0A0C1JNU4_9BACT|nr:amino acid permease [Candidatus Protochlamydia amoebophila]KIC72211.1 putative bumetanide-sensitive Na-K-Cl [Candidatus Protochlamydia amoebophila]